MMAEAQHDILCAHVNLPIERRIEITLSSTAFSMFAAFALIEIIAHVRRQHRMVKLHATGLVTTAVAAIAQAVDERTIDEKAILFIAPD